MYIQTWKKYLPVIKILIKRSLQEEQVLEMNQTDFQRASGGKKIRLGFDELVFGKGKSIQTQIPNALARDLLLVLKDHYPSTAPFDESPVQLSMDNQCRLTIRRVIPEQTDEEKESGAETNNATNEPPVEDEGAIDS